MDRRVIFAVAGSGKTTHIINQLSIEKRSLVITYTLSNLRNLREGVYRKFGFFPESVRLQSYFNFLYTFCYRPFLSMKFNAKGINYESNPNRYLKQSDSRYFLDARQRLYSNRIARFLEVQGVMDDVNTRIARYFDNLFVDEVQDFAGHDFNLLKHLAKAPVDIILVGDFYQHTFDTSRDANVNAHLHDDYAKYKALFEGMGVHVDTTSLVRSYRCSPTICEFVTNNIGIEIQSHRSDETAIKYVDSKELAESIFQDNSIVKLFYREHSKYGGCYSKNWGDCKGEDRYNDVCVVLNKTTLGKFSQNLSELTPQTKNKLYVACTRVKRDLYFVPYSLFEHYKDT
jgi:DNA helicase-2/ATP-dependent DNA helicase PcrA